MGAEGGGPAIQMPMPQNMLESEMIGAIKIKDGLFIGDELASTVSQLCLPNKHWQSTFMHLLVSQSVQKASICMRDLSTRAR